MKTQNDVLSFHDLEVQRYVEKNELCISLAYAEEMANRWIHTFLEWDLYDGYIYNLGWSLTYTACQGDHPPIVAGTKVDTLQEAEIMAIKKVSRFIGEQIHLESMKESQFLTHPSPYDMFYKVLNGADEYCGMVEIARMEQLK